MDSLARKRGAGFAHGHWLMPSVCVHITTLSILLAWLLTGCDPTKPVHDYCQLAKPIYLAKGEAAKLSDATAREILLNNETWAKVCKK